MADYKHCAICDQSKPTTAEHWYMRRNRPVHPCRTCWRVRAAERYQTNRDLLVDVARRYRARLRENGEWAERLKRQAEREREKYNRLSQEERSTLARTKYERCDKERRLQKQKERRAVRSEEFAEKKREYRSRNSEKTRESGRRCQRKRRLDPINRINSSIQSAVVSHLKSAGLRKRRSKHEIFGWTLQELRNHIEALLDEGMTFENYGKWHIDHIVPIGRLRPTSENCPVFKAAWALRNLAPLWASDNIAKLHSLHWSLPESYTNPKLREMYENPDPFLIEVAA